jgi:hypothetical protein
MVMEREKSHSKYGQWIIGIMLLAYVSTSFNLSFFSFRSPLITVGKMSFQENTLRNSIREARAHGQLMLLSPPDGDRYWLRKVLNDAMWDQEVKEKGIQVSQNQAKQSLREKMCFLDDSGRVNLPRLKAFYQKNPIFFGSDMQSSEDFTVTEHSTRHVLFRGNASLLGPEDRFDQAKMDAFLRNNGVTLLQMIAAEQRALGRMILKRSLARNVFLPSFYKTFAEKGMRQTRSFRSKVFAFDYSRISDIQIAKKETDALVEKAPKWMRSAPEMRTFGLMLTPNFSTTSPTAKKYTNEALKVLIQDAVGAGQGIQDVAKEKGWPVGSITCSVSSKGLDFAPISWRRSDGTEWRLPQDIQSKILDGVFSGQEGDVFHLPVMAGGVVWIQVQGVQGARPLSPKELVTAAQYHLKTEKVKELTKEKAQKFEININKKEMTSHTISMHQKIPQDVSDEMAMYVLQMTPPPVTSVFKTNDGYAVIELTDITTEKPADADEQSSTFTGLDREWKKQFINAYEKKLQEKHRIVFSEKASDNSYLLDILNRGAPQDDSGDDENQGFDD